MNLPQRKTKLSRSDKMRATLAAKKVQFDSQTIIIDEHWRIVRADELNWEVQLNGKFHGYFGSLKNAFVALLGKMLTEIASRDLQNVTNQISEVERKIEAAL